MGKATGIQKRAASGGHENERGPVTLVIRMDRRGHNLASPCGKRESAGPTRDASQLQRERTSIQPLANRNFFGIFRSKKC